MEESIEIVKGNKFYEIAMRGLCKINNVEYNSNIICAHIEYNPNMSDFQYEMIREITHDGTFIFEYDMMLKMFGELLNHETIYVDYKDVIDDIKMVNYEIGDLIIKNEYVGRSMVKQTFKLPIKCEVIYK